MFQWRIYELTVVSVMRMYKLKRDFEWHEHIKLCYTRLYALAATLHKCALISNASHCCVRCMCATNLPGKTFLRVFKNCMHLGGCNFFILFHRLSLKLSFSSFLFALRSLHIFTHIAFVAASMVFYSLSLKNCILFSIHVGDSFENK